VAFQVIQGSVLIPDELLVRLRANASLLLHEKRKYSGVGGRGDEFALNLLQVLQARGAHDLCDLGSVAGATKGNESDGWEEANGICGGGEGESLEDAEASAHETAGIRKENGLKEEAVPEATGGEGGF
jgi:hypothetical protein